MRKKKNTRTINDVSVSKLLDEFVDLTVEDGRKGVENVDDDEYISMMLEKEDKMKQERAKRTLSSSTQEDVDIQPLPIDDIKKPHPYIEPNEIAFEATCESDLSLEDEAVVDEIMKSQDLMDAPVLAGSMKASVEFLQAEVSTRESRRRARKTLEKYRKDPPSSTTKEVAPVISEKKAPIKRCQTCYFCVGERKVSGSCWCHCTNAARSTHAIVKGSRVKSRLNLPCWKPPQD